MTPAAVIGIDLSLRHSALALFDGRLVTIAADAVPDDDHQGAMERMASIAQHLYNEILVAPPELVVIEGYSFASHQRHARAVAELGGVARMVLWRMRVPYLDCPPKSVKRYATGNGNSGKTAMIIAARDRLGYDGENDDEADALWLRALGCALLGTPIVELPKTHIAALDALARMRPVLEGANA